MQTLRRYREPVSGAVLAHEMGISLRSLYRDIASLQAQGAQIEGEAGLGYVLKPGFVLPPLMFSKEEIEALVLGSRWVASRADTKLGEAALNVIAKISAVLPQDLRHELESSTLLIGPSAQDNFNASSSNTFSDAAVASIRQAIRAEQKMALSYRDGKGKETARIVWPFAMGFFETTQIMVAWCELRTEVRHFRADRIGSAELLPERYPKRRMVLLKEWRQSQGISDTPS